MVYGEKRLLAWYLANLVVPWFLGGFYIETEVTGMSQYWMLIGILFLTFACIAASKRPVLASRLSIGLIVTAFLQLLPLPLLIFGALGDSCVNYILGHMFVIFDRQTENVTRITLMVVLTGLFVALFAYLIGWVALSKEKAILLYHGNAT